MSFTFDFDPQKSASNQIKHGIDFIGAQELWKGKVTQNPATTVGGEIRYINIGKIGVQHWTAVVTYRGSVRRIISVRPSNQREIEAYERSAT